METIGWSSVTVFDKWEIEVLEQDLKGVIKALDDFGLDELEVPFYVLQRYSKGAVSVFDVSMLTKVLERDLRLKRCGWENGYLYLRW